MNPDPAGLSAEKPEWFDPTAVLTTVRGLIDQLERSPRAVKNGKGVALDLRVLEEALTKAEQTEVRFHFVMLD